MTSIVGLGNDLTLDNDITNEYVNSWTGLNEVG